ncbi:MAG: hypothetical protein H7Y18_17480 [Clostridiaceae bacterium]|nr:hypothetical protein [Clostridiaceae bacterium]
MDNLISNKKSDNKGIIPVILFILSFIYISIHSYRVSIGMVSGRFIYSILSLTTHLLVPAIIALLYYLIRKRKISFLKVFFITTFIVTVIAYISTIFL